MAHVIGPHTRSPMHDVAVAATLTGEMVSLRPRTWRLCFPHGITGLTQHTFRPLKEPRASPPADNAELLRCPY